MKCEDCIWYMKGEKLDYTNGGCVVKPMDGFICIESHTARWMVGFDGACEEWEHRPWEIIGEGGNKHEIN